IQISTDVRALDRDFEVIPFARLERILAICRRHSYPATPTALVQPARVLALARIDLHLHSFDVRAMLRVDPSDPGMDKHATVSFRLALELEAQVKIPIRLFG